MINSAMFSSATEEWATPQAFFDELNKEFLFTLIAHVRTILLAIYSMNY